MLNRLLLLLHLLKFFPVLCIHRIELFTEIVHLCFRVLPFCGQSIFNFFIYITDKLTYFLTFCLQDSFKVRLLHVNYYFELTEHLNQLGIFCFLYLGLVFTDFVNDEVCQLIFVFLLFLLLFCLFNKSLVPNFAHSFKHVHLIHAHYKLMFLKLIKRYSFLRSRNQYLTQQILKPVRNRQLWIKMVHWE